MAKYIINNSESLAEVEATLRKEYREAKYLRVSIARGFDRSLAQNNQLHAWISQLVVRQGHETFYGYKRLAKLHFFVPVLRAEDEDFRQKWDNIFPRESRRDPDQYKRKLDAMYLMPVSSVCTVEQFSRAMEDMQKHYASLETDPVDLVFGDEWRIHEELINEKVEMEVVS